MLFAGNLRAQEWDRDWQERFEVQMERLGRRLQRIGRVVDRTVSRSLERAFEDGVQVRWDSAWEDDADWSWSEPDEDAAQGSPERFSWEGQVKPGGTVEIKGVNGPVVAEASSDDHVRVVAEKRGRHDDPADVRIDVVEHDGGVTICAVYPSEGHRANRCAPGDEGHISSHDNDVRVAFHVEVPRDARFAGRTINGDVRAQGLTGDVTAHTVNGSVALSTLGQAEGWTVNGSIKARLGRLDGGLEFRTVNGSIDLDLPDDANADIDAHWLNGGVESDLPLTLQGRLSKHSARGRLGEGGPTIALRTVNGSIKIR